MCNYVSMGTLRPWPYLSLACKRTPLLACAVFRAILDLSVSSDLCLCLQNLSVKVQLATVKNVLRRKWFITKLPDYFIFFCKFRPRKFIWQPRNSLKGFVISVLDFPKIDFISARVCPRLDCLTKCWRETKSRKNWKFEFVDKKKRLLFL